MDEKTDHSAKAFTTLFVYHPMNFTLHFNKSNRKSFELGQFIDL